MTTTSPLTITLLDPAGLTAHPRNVRADLGDLSGLTASIAAQGVIEPLTVVPLPDGGHLLVAGHRRAAAAIAAGLDEVPCVVRTDLAAAADAASTSDVAEHIGAMLAENLHREGLTAVEEARGVQAMLDLGVPLSKVPKATGLDQKRVKKAIGVARLDQGTADMVADMGLTLDQAAVVALYADDPETSAKLASAATQGPGHFSHAVTRAQQDRKNAEILAKVRTELEQQGVALVESTEHAGTKNRRLTSLDHDGEPLTPEVHASCPGRAIALSQSWDGDVYQVEVCTDIKKHGHTDRWASGATSKPETPEEKEAAKAERRRVIENNKAMAAANITRRAWLKEYLARTTAPKEVLRFAVEEIAANPRVFESWLTGMPAGGDGKDAAEALGLHKPGRTHGAVPETLTSGKHVPDARLPLQLLAHVGGAIESSISRDSWRSTSEEQRADRARWLTFLVSQGYTLSDVEQLIVDGPQR